MDSFPALGNSVWQTAPVLPRQGQKQPRLLKVHEFKLTDTVSSPTDIRQQWHSPVAGLGLLTPPGEPPGAGLGVLRALHKPEAAVTVRAAGDT